VSDWLPFADAVKDATSGNAKILSREYDESGSIPIVDQGRELIGGYTSQKDAEYSGDIPCIVFGDHTKIFKYVDFPFALGADGVKVLTSKTKDIMVPFLYYYLRSQKLPDAGYSRHFKFLKKLRVPVIPIDEQRRIVGLLDRAAEIRRRADEARAKARAIIPALFLDMFGDPATNPKGWPIFRLSALLETPLSYGSMESPKAGDSAWRDIRVANIKNGYLDHSDSKFVDISRDKVEKHTLRNGDIVVARAIASKEHLGKCAVAWPHREKWAYDSHVMRIRVEQSATHPTWLHSFLCSEGGRSLLLSRARATAIQHNINTKEVAATQVSLPPIALQTIFAEKANRIEATARALDAAAAKAEAMAAALSAEVFG